MIKNIYYVNIIKDELYWISSLPKHTIYCVVNNDC